MHKMQNNCKYLNRFIDNTRKLFHDEATAYL